MFLVDTGATDCMVPASGLQQAGIRRRGRKACEMADGSPVEYDFGLAEIEFLQGDRLGYWEQRGYHNGADPWLEQRLV